MWECLCGAELTVDSRDVDVLDVQTQGVWHVEVSCGKCRRRLRITKSGVTVLSQPVRKTIIRGRK